MNLLAKKKIHLKTFCFLMSCYGEIYFKVEDMTKVKYIKSFLNFLCN